MSWTNFHSHTAFSDGKGKPENYIVAAIEQGIKIYGFSDHAPIDFATDWAMKHNDLPTYLQSIQALKEKYTAQIAIYTSMEVDYIPDVISIQHLSIRAAELDYTVGSVHYVNKDEAGTHWNIDGGRKEFDNGLKAIYDNDLKTAVTDYFVLTRKMMDEAAPDIVGHMDKIKMNAQHHPDFSEKHEWYKKEVLNTLEVIKASGRIIEVNTRGEYKRLCAEPYPSTFILQYIHDLGIPITINSDCHHPREITAHFSKTAKMLTSIGFKNLMIFDGREWLPCSFSDSGINLF